MITGETIEIKPIADLKRFFHLDNEEVSFLLHYIRLSDVTLRRRIQYIRSETTRSLMRIAIECPNPLFIAQIMERT